jgi:uncharacterized protein (DUF1778 family)
MRIRTVTRSARLEARITPELQALLKRAAEIEGRSVSDFVVSAVREAACRTIEEGEILRIAVEDQRRFAAALIDPPAPAPALERAFRRRRDLVRAS